MGNRLFQDPEVVLWDSNSYQYCVSCGSTDSVLSMAHKTFISYKYSESQELRDRIIQAMGSDAAYYTGETSESPDMSDLKTATIRKKLADMIYSTSVTIVIISPHMKESNWIDWEIEYSLTQTTRNDRTSRINGVVGVVMKVNGGYDWFIHPRINCHGTQVVTYDNSLLYPIISNNHFNSEPEQWHCSQCKTFDWLNGSYIEYVKEEDFLLNPSMYVENAYTKSQNGGAGYRLQRTRKN